MDSGIADNLLFCSEKMLIECCVQRTPQILRMELPVSMTARNFGIMCSIFAINASASTVRGDVIAYPLTSCVHTKLRT